MTLILTPKDKAQSIFLLEEVLARFVKPGVLPAQWDAVKSHLAAMSATSSDMIVACSLSTDDKTGETEIRINCKFPGQVKQ